MYRACRCRCSPQCDPDMCHRSGRGSKHTRWRLVHSAARRNPSHSYMWRSHQCWHTDHRARKGWYLMIKGKRHAWKQNRPEVGQRYTLRVVTFFSFLPMLHSSLSMLQVLPTYPGLQLQLNMPLMGLVSHWEPSLQGLLIQASSLWQSKPEKNTMLTRNE